MAFRAKKSVLDGMTKKGVGNGGATIPKKLAWNHRCASTTASSLFAKVRLAAPNMQSKKKTTLAYLIFRPPYSNANKQGLTCGLVCGVLINERAARCSLTTATG